MDKFPTPNEVRKVQELGDLKRSLLPSKPEKTRRAPRFHKNPYIKKEHKR